MKGAVSDADPIHVFCQIQQHLFTFIAVCIGVFFFPRSPGVEKCSTLGIITGTFYSALQWQWWRGREDRPSHPTLTSSEQWLQRRNHYWRSLSIHVCTTYPVSHSKNEKNYAWRSVSLAKMFPRPQNLMNPHRPAGPFPPSLPACFSLPFIQSKCFTLLCRHLYILYLLMTQLSAKLGTCNTLPWRIFLFIATKAPQLNKHYLSSTLCWAFSALVDTDTYSDFNTSDRFNS